MSDRVFLTIGTPGGRWCTWLDGLLGFKLAGPGDNAVRQPGWQRAAWTGRSGDLLVDGQAPGSGPATLESWLQRLPEAHWLVLVERPAPGLAAALAAGSADDLAQWLQDWCDGARRLLLLAQRDPVRCLLVDAEEAMQQPAALVAGIQQRFGADALDAPAPTDLAPLDPLSRALAEALCAADPTAGALFAELQASCVLLAPAMPVGDTAQPALLADALAAARGLQALRLRAQGAEHDVARHTSELAAAAAAQRALQQQLAARGDELARLTQAHQTQAQALQDALASGAGLQRDMDALRQEGELLLQQLHEVQSELEAMFLARRDIEQRLAACTTERDAGAQKLAEQAQLLSQRDAALQQQASQWQDSQARLAALQADVLRSSQARDQVASALQAAQEAHALQAAQAAEALAALRAAHAQQAAEAAEALAAAQAAQAQQAAESAEALAAALAAQDQQAAEAAEALAAAQAAHAQQVAEAAEALAAAQAAQDLQAAEAAEALAAAQAAHAQQAAEAAEALAAAKAAHAQQAAQAANALKDAQAARQASDTARQEQAAVLQKLQLDLAEQQRAKAGLQQENALLLQQLHQVQEELEQYFLECQRLQEAAALVPPVPAGQAVAMAEVLPLAERDTPPYRELTFQLRGVVAHGRQIPEATVRLVEHRGHPGLAVFGNTAGEQLLSCWRETGQEDGHPYMLLVPADAPVKAVLDAMGPADWALTLYLLDRLPPALDALDPPLSPRWQQLVRRLQLQLQVLGRRVRYQQVVVGPVPGAAPGALAFQFNQVHWGALQVPRVTAHWQPDGPQAGITLLNDAETGPPLASWPADAQGMPVERWHLPLGRAVAGPVKRAAWAQLGLADRDFLLALLEIWPQALAPSDGGPSAGAPAQLPAAQALLPDALQALGPPAGWRAVRRALAAWRQA